MQRTAESIFEAASKLPEGDRIDLVNRLMETLPHPPELLSLDDPDLVAKLDQRAADEAGSVSWSVLKNE